MSASDAPARPHPDFTAELSAVARRAPDSGIVAVMNYGRERRDLVRLWVGEGELPTPAFICDAATRALAAGETFYTYQHGLPELRQTIADYHTRLFGRPFAADRFFATTSGMHAFNIALGLVVNPGEEVIVPSPTWPNVPAAVAVHGAVPRIVPIDYRDRRWVLDIDRIAAAIGPATRAIVLNSPANPTGWVADRAVLQAVLDLARQHGLWIIADEVYGRFSFGGERAPSFHDVADDADRVLWINTFSKNWAMTGWRLGWLEAPPEFAQPIENLVQYSTSGLPAFLQRGAIAAMQHGDGFIAYQNERVRQALGIVNDALAGANRVTYAVPDGAFYLFMAVEGFDDTRELAFRLIDEAGVGLAPGTAFGPGGERFLRLCLARSEAQIRQGAERLHDWLMRT
ncbi:pyridoxal phosphate-dependent aminotransferase [Pseudoxanthobacter sp.]|uniref:pyridoxal phosphate-dependent aminotransferase n=1 Tax=Pseudoxanthobacter sp. TaxID=1925742 RepID=UPI002FE179D3